MQTNLAWNISFQQFLAQECSHISIALGDYSTLDRDQAYSTDYST